MEKAIAASAVAQREYMKCSLSDRKRFIDAIRKKVLIEANIGKMSEMAVEETGMGNFEHKCIKNRLAANKTPGLEDLLTEAYTGDDGLTLLEYSPFRVIGAITPTTNPSETIICNAIGMLAGGNSVVFSTHPRANHTSQFTRADQRGLAGSGRAAQPHHDDSQTDDGRGGGPDKASRCANAGRYRASRAWCARC